MSSKPAAIRFKCPACRYKIKVDAAFAGKAGKCPKCMAALWVPGGEEAAAKAAPADAPVKKRAPSDAKDRPRERARPDSDDRAPSDAKDRSRKRARPDSDDRAGPDTRDRPRKRARPDSDSDHDSEVDEDSICPACDEPNAPDATECEVCGIQIGHPGYVNTVFSISGWGLIIMGCLNGLNALFLLAKTGGRALIPAAIAGVIAVAMVRIGLGMREKNKLTVGVAAVLGLLVMLVNVPLALAVLSGARIYLVPGVRLSAPGVLLALLLNLTIYFPPIVLGIRYRQSIEWT